MGQAVSASAATFRGLPMAILVGLETRDPRGHLRRPASSRAQAAPDAATLDGSVAEPSRHRVAGAGASGIRPTWVR
jgi:hypothetical protein